MVGTIVVLCPDLQTAKDSFDIFVSYVDELWPLDSSCMIDEYACIVETYHGMRYIFCNESMQDVYRCISDDFMWYEEFLEGIA